MTCLIDDSICTHFAYLRHNSVYVMAIIVLTFLLVNVILDLHTISRS